MPVLVICCQNKSLLNVYIAMLQAGPKPSNFSVGLWTYAQLTPSI